jgi:hypothetical protein
MVEVVSELLESRRDRQADAELSNIAGIKVWFGEEGPPYRESHKE